MTASRRPGWLTQFVASPAHGPLPGLLLLLTVSTGLVDAVSILSLGRVFVANMTGNIVFIGFALAGSPGFSLQASVLALAGFLVGASVGGALVTRHAAQRGRLLRNAVAVELILLVVAVVVLAAAGRPYGTAVQDVAVVLAAVALGVQNASVRAIAVPDLTTTVLTMTLTGVAADLRKRDFTVAFRRILAVLAMLVGALVGALLVRYASPAVAMGVAAAIVALTLAGAVVAAGRTAPWQSADHH